jgi:tripartite-type tricarboxylate transporter receptor subunit TctC
VIRVRRSVAGGERGQLATRRSLLLALVASVGVRSLHAEGWPERTVQMIVPYPPGGPTDITARIYAARLEGELHQPFVPENRPGAGGELGAAAVARAAADGYTLLFGAVGSLAIHAVLPGEHPGYELTRAFRGVSIGSSTPLAVAVRSALPVASIQALIELAKAKPSSLTFGSAGDGSTQHMTGEYFQQAAGVKLLHVPYKGSAPAVNDLLGGQIDMVFETLPPLAPHLAGGRLKALAVTSRDRAELLPDMPTLDESGMAGFDVSTFYGMLAPHDTPAHAVERLSVAMQRIAAHSDTQAILKQQGARAVATTPEATDALIKAEVEKWDRVARLAKLK